MVRWAPTGFSTYTVGSPFGAMEPVPDHNVKNVLVLGGSYGGSHAAMVLARKLPPTHRVILIERNTHFNRTSPHVLTLL